MLQNAPMYSYIPAKDVTRARKFYEEKLGIKPKQETAGALSTNSATVPRASCIRRPTPAPPRQTRRSGRSMTSNGLSQT
jgi:predicted enzyme related to lactoylglutathione lyase